MSLQEIAHIGEYVRMGYYLSSTYPSGLPVGLYDRNNKPRVLQPFEQIVIDTIECLTSGYGPVYVLDGNVGGPGSFTAANILAVLDDTSVLNAQSFISAGPFTVNFTNDGLSVSPGNVPYLYALNTNGGSGPFLFSGIGRIVTAGTQGVRPNWKEKLTAGGNF